MTELQIILAILVFAIAGAGLAGILVECIYNDDGW